MLWQTLPVGTLGKSAIDLQPESIEKDQKSNCESSAAQYFFLLVGDWSRSSSNKLKTRWSHTCAAWGLSFLDHILIAFRDSLSVNAHDFCPSVLKPSICLACGAEIRPQVEIQIKTERKKVEENRKHSRFLQIARECKRDLETPKVAQSPRKTKENKINLSRDSLRSFSVAWWRISACRTPSSFIWEFIARRDDLKSHPHST